MWIMTTGNELVNIAGARRIVVEPDATGDTMRVVAYFGDPITVPPASLTLAETTQRGDREYATTVANAYYRAIQEALRDGDPYCNLCDYGAAT